MDVGAALRSAREERRLSLNHLADATKISVAVLTAIEGNDIDKLPGGIFTRGFLRAYAREVGLDPDDIVRRYLDQFKRRADVLDAPPGVADHTPASPDRAIHGVTSVEETERKAARMQWQIIVTVVVISVAGYFTFSRSRVPRPTPEASPSETTRSPTTAAAGPTETATPGSRETRPVATNGEMVRLDLQAHGACWLSATADSTRVAYRLMTVGDRQTIEARDEIVLRVGDPSAVTFSINGKAGRSLGRPGEAVTIHVTPQNYPALIGR
jgi:cytoskeleton protein RodZ